MQKKTVTRYPHPSYLPWMCFLSGNILLHCKLRFWKDTVILFLLVKGFHDFLCICIQLQYGKLGILLLYAYLLYHMVIALKLDIEPFFQNQSNKSFVTSVKMTFNSVARLHKIWLTSGNCCKLVMLPARLKLRSFPFLASHMCSAQMD